MRTAPPLSALLGLLFVPLGAAPGVAAGLAAPHQSAAPSAAPDLSTPEKTLEAFFDALGRNDLLAMVPCVLDATVSPVLEQVQRQNARSPMPGSLVLSDVRVYTNAAGDEALVSFRPALRSEGRMLDLRGAPAEEGRPPREVLVLRKSGDMWKVVAPAPEDLDRRDGVSGPESAGALALMVRHPDTLLRARQAAQTAASLSNVKQICLAVLTYAQDYDEVLALDAAGYSKALAPYVRDRAVFTSPLDPPKTVSYRLNPQTARKSMAKFADPAALVLIYEGEYKRPLFRHDGRAVIGFADGHVKLVTPEEAKRLRWTP